ncbi:MAG: 5-(carboxyamino)imidazole ribonucleotide synthase [Ilumatobacteraceae bacterium]
MTAGADPIVPPARIGMLGGGQLGRYALLAARVMGYGTVVLDPDPTAPAGRVADEHVVATYDDPGALDRLAATCAVVTTEFENPPAAALERLARDVVVAPPASAVAVAQDRIAEKRFLAGIGVPTAPFTVGRGPERTSGTDSIVYPAIVKTARLGYDGKGQRSVASSAERDAALDELAVECVVEQRVPLDTEISVLVARTVDGRTVVYPIAENHHVAGILDLTVVPARVSPGLAAEAGVLAVSIARQLQYVGVLAVEMFVSEGRLLVNELAPRPHNSGHWTLDAAVTDQFAQQVRAICGLALGSPDLTTGSVAMVNLLGDLWSGGEPGWSSALGDPDARLHLYGKAAARRGRKMGHLTVLGDSGAAGVDDVVARAIELRAGLLRR